MKSNAKNIKLPSYDEIFKTEDERLEEQKEKIELININELYPFKNHPFKVLDDEKMGETVESIKKFGVLVPGLVRPRAEGGYEIVAGHRRCRASALAGLTEMPVIIREMDDDAATIIMVDSNLQREVILPSEKAFAFKMKLEAMKRQGARRDLTSSQFGTKLEKGRADEILAEQVGESRNQIQRYIRLTELVPELLVLVDEKKVALNSAVELSYIPKEEQSLVEEAMERDEASPSLKQARKIRKYSDEGKLSESVLEVILNEEKPLEEKIVFKSESIKKYFPDGYTSKQIENEIIKILEKMRESQKGMEL